MGGSLIGIRTGQQFLAGIQTAREVYINGEQISDVTVYPPFRQPLAAVARLYDLKHDPAYQDQLAYVSPSTGDLVDVSFLIPKSREDLRRKQNAYLIYAKAHYGQLGRPPEFMNTMVAGLCESADWFGQWGSQFAENVRNYYQYVRENDLFLTHALGTPQTDRSKPSHQQRDVFLHLGVKAETSDGLIVQGAKQLATMGPLTDEVLVFPNGRQFTTGDERYCIAFAIPVTAPGLKFLCREPLVSDDRRTLYDHPLSARFEEIDAMLVFDDVLIPWDRVFFYNSLEAANTMRFQTESSGGALGAVSALRAFVNAGLLVAVAMKMTESVKTNVYPQVGERLGRMAAMLQASEGLIRLAEETATVNEHGTWLLNRSALQAHQILYPQFYALMADLIRQMAGSGLMLTPKGADFMGAAGDLFSQYFGGATMDGCSRVQIAKLAWDMVGDTLSQRLLHYERFHAGEPMFFAANFARRVDVSKWMQLADQLLEEGRSVLAEITH